MPTAHDEIPQPWLGSRRDVSLVGSAVTFLDACTVRILCDAGRRVAQPVELLLLFATPILFAFANYDIRRFLAVSTLSMAADGSITPS
jgi:hypothetical protein